MTFLGDLITDATGSTVSLSELLRRVKVLASRTNSPELARWTNQELDGYPDWMTLPDYRGPLDTMVKGDFSGPFGSHQSGIEIPMTSLPEDMRIPALFKVFVLQSVSEIEAVLSSMEDKSKQLRVPWPPEVTNRVNWLIQEEQVTLIPMHGLETVYGTLSPWKLQSVLDSVRSRLLDLALELEKVAPDLMSDGSGSPREVVTQAQVAFVYNTVVMEGSTGVIGGQAIILQALQGKPLSDENLLSRLRTIGVDESLVQELQAGLNDDGDDRREPGAGVKNWLGKVVTEGAKKTGKALLKVGADVVTELVLARYGVT